MPELPEVEVLVRNLAPLLNYRTVRRVVVLRSKILTPTSVQSFQRALTGATFSSVSRRGKYLIFGLNRAAQLNRHSRSRQLRQKVSSVQPGNSLWMLGHLGMTGRMYLIPAAAALPKHAAVVFDLGKDNFVFEDTRYFGRLTLDLSPLGRLGPEPLSAEFSPDVFRLSLRHSSQPIKVKLLDQSLVVGIGNIYASEALFRAGISPRVAARRLTRTQVYFLWNALKEVLEEAIRFGSTVPLNFSGIDRRDRIFYYGSQPEPAASYQERLQVYDRTGLPCHKCAKPIQRLIQAGRSTFFCAKCQRS